MRIPLAIRHNLDLPLKLLMPRYDLFLMVIIWSYFAQIHGKVMAN